MADNLDVKDAAGVTRKVRTTDDGVAHTQIGRAHV